MSSGAVLICTLRVNLSKNYNSLNLWTFITKCIISLSHFSLEPSKRVTGKQCRPRTDATNHGIWSGSTLFVLDTGISIKCHSNKKLTSHPAAGNRPVQSWVGVYNNLRCVKSLKVFLKGILQTAKTQISHCKVDGDKQWISNWSGTALFVIKYVNFYRQPGYSDLTDETSKWAWHLDLFSMTREIFKILLETSVEKMDLFHLCLSLG